MTAIGGFIRDFGRGLVRMALVAFAFYVLVGVAVYSMSIDMKGGTISIPVSASSSLR